MVMVDGRAWIGMSLNGRADYDGLATEGVWVVSGSWAGSGFRSTGSFSLGVLLGRKVSPFHRTLRSTQAANVVSTLVHGPLVQGPLVMPML